MSDTVAIQRQTQKLQALSSDVSFTVFLCGPSLKSEQSSARLRQAVFDELSREKFTVVLGEDDGLENLRTRYGGNAQDNELMFIEECNAVIIIADSPGAHCELGLFSWHYVHKEGWFYAMEPKPYLVVLMNEVYKHHQSYLNEGPLASVIGQALVEHVDYSSYNIDDLIKKLKNHRIMVGQDRRGRPRKKKLGSS